MLCAGNEHSEKAGDGFVEMCCCCYFLGCLLLLPLRLLADLLPLSSALQHSYRLLVVVAVVVPSGSISGAAAAAFKSCNLLVAPRSLTSAPSFAAISTAAAVLPPLLLLLLLNYKFLSQLSASAVLAHYRLVLCYAVLAVVVVVVPFGTHLDTVDDYCDFVFVSPRARLPLLLNLSFAVLSACSL